MNKPIWIEVKKLKYVHKASNYIEHLLIFGCVSISAFASSAATPIDITKFEIGLKICAVAVWIK